VGAIRSAISNFFPPRAVAERKKKKEKKNLKKTNIKKPMKSQKKRIKKEYGCLINFVGLEVISALIEWVKSTTFRW
jgi:hypothetical protein